MVMQIFFGVDSDDSIQIHSDLASSMAYRHRSAAIGTSDSDALRFFAKDFKSGTTVEDVPAAAVFLALCLQWSTMNLLIDCFCFVSTAPWGVKSTRIFPLTFCARALLIFGVVRCVTTLPLIVMTRIYRPQLRSKDFKNIESWIFWTVTRHLCNANVFQKLHPPALSAEALALSSQWPRRVGIVARGTWYDLNAGAWSGFVHAMLYWIWNYSRSRFFNDNI